MRDGVVLRADVHRPAGDGRFPVLVYRTPYSRVEAPPDPIVAAAAEDAVAPRRADEVVGPGRLRGRRGGGGEDRDDDEGGAAEHGLRMTERARSATGARDLSPIPHGA